MEERIVDLESRLAFQEEAIETLTRRLLDQQRQMEQMAREIAQLTELVREAAGNASPLASDPRHEPPPPHY